MMELMKKKFIVNHLHLKKDKFRLKLIKFLIKIERNNCREAKIIFLVKKIKSISINCKN